MIGSKKAREIIAGSEERERSKEDGARSVTEPA